MSASEFTCAGACELDDASTSHWLAGPSGIARLGFDRTRTLQWAAAHCALSECWNREAGDNHSFNLTMLPLLLDAMDRST